MTTKEIIYTGTNGINGANGAEGKAGESGQIGSSGEKGGQSGKNGKSGKGGDSGINGSHAESWGTDGGYGTDGTDGLDVESTIVLTNNRIIYNNNRNENFELNPEDELLIDSSGGTGGTGGDGGDGGDGGAGGAGGDGGAGGRAVTQNHVAKKKNNGGDGGKGGNGGNSGNGGDASGGGAGGDAGNGGNSGNNILIVDDSRLFSLVKLQAKQGSSGTSGNGGKAGNGGNATNGGAAGKGGSGTIGANGGRWGKTGGDGNSGKNGKEGKTGKSGNSGKNGKDGNPGTIEYVLKTSNQTTKFKSSYDLKLELSILEDGNISDGILSPGEEIQLSVVLNNIGEMPFPKGATITISSNNLEPKTIHRDLPEFGGNASYKFKEDVKVSPETNDGDILKINYKIDFPGICTNYRYDVLERDITMPIIANCDINKFPKSIYPNKKNSIYIDIKNKSKVTYGASENKKVEIKSQIIRGDIEFKGLDKEYSIIIDSIKAKGSNKFEIPLITKKLIDNNNQNIEIITSVFVLDSSVLEIHNLSVVTPKKQSGILLMAILGIFILIPLQRVFTNHIKIAIAITVLPVALLLFDFWRIDTQGLNIVVDWFKLSFLYGFVAYLVFQTYDIVNILNGKYKDSYGNILHKGKMSPTQPGQNKPNETSKPKNSSREAEDIFFDNRKNQPKTNTPDAPIKNEPTKENAPNENSSESDDIFFDNRKNQPKKNSPDEPIKKESSEETPSKDASSEVDDIFFDNRRKK
mgnify:FL=1